MPISLFGGAEREPARMLQEGWQLHSPPNDGEKVGSVFRIDQARVKRQVMQVAIETRRSAEAGLRMEQRIETRIGFFARLFGLDSYGGRLNAERVETLEFAMVDPVREAADDMAMEQAMAPVLEGFKYRAENDYYVIRETRSATAITYRLSRTLLGEMGGEASVAGAIGVGASLSAGRDGLFDLSQNFERRMYVMFLAEEIKPVTAGLAGARPILGRMPVRSPLTWDA